MFKKENVRDNNVGLAKKKSNVKIMDCLKEIYLLLMMLNSKEKKIFLVLGS